MPASRDDYLNRSLNQARLFYPGDTDTVLFPIQSVTINWDRLVSMREVVLRTIDGMPPYLLKPEVLALIEAEKHPTYRLILDLMWSTGARISEVLSLKPSSFFNKEYGFMVKLNTVNHKPGRPKETNRRSRNERYIPITDTQLLDRIQVYLTEHHIKGNARCFPYVRQTVNRHIHALVERVGGAPFSISSHTFRHSFAIHLLLNGRPIKIVSQLLGHQSIESTEIYTNVFTIDLAHFLDGVEFH